MRSRTAARDRGMVTAELAACLPVLVLLVAVSLSAVTVADVRLRVDDAAREAARAAARGDVPAALRLAEAAAPGVRIALSSAAGIVTVSATLQVHLLAQALPAVTVTEHAVAAVEPQAGPP